MCSRKVEVALRYDIPAERLDLYENAGVLRPIHRNGEALYSDLRVALIGKAERLGFSFKEITILISHTIKGSDDDFGCPVCRQQRAPLAVSFATEETFVLSKGSSLILCVYNGRDQTERFCNRLN